MLVAVLPRATCSCLGSTDWRRSKSVGKGFIWFTVWSWMSQMELPCFLLLEKISKWKFAVQSPRLQSKNSFSLSLEICAVWASNTPNHPQTVSWGGCWSLHEERKISYFCVLWDLRNFSSKFSHFVGGMSRKSLSGHASASPLNYGEAPPKHEFTPLSRSLSLMDFFSLLHPSSPTLQLSVPPLPCENWAFQQSS